MDAVKKYHETAKEYRKSLQEAWSAYEAGYKRIERYKGGKDYDKDLAKLQDTRDAAIKAAQDKARGSFDTIIKYMRKAIESAPMQTPTAEQMTIVNALKMRDKVEADELRKAAEQMRGVDVAVKVLDEIAAKNGHPGIMGEYMGAAGRAEKAVNELVSSANLMLRLTRPDGISTRHAAHHAAKWGGEWDARHEGVELRGDSNDYALSAVDRDFKDERETACALGGVEGFYKEFRSTVNYNPGVKDGLQKLWGEV